MYVCPERSVLGLGGVPHGVPGGAPSGVPGRVWSIHNGTTMGGIHPNIANTTDPSTDHPRDISGDTSDGGWHSRVGKFSKSNLNGLHGVVVSALMPGSPLRPSSTQAAGASKQGDRRVDRIPLSQGLQPNDVILAVNGRPVANFRVRINQPINQRGRSMTRGLHHPPPGPCAPRLSFYVSCSLEPAP